MIICSDYKDKLIIQADIAHFVKEAAKNREADDLFRKVCDLRRNFDTYLHNESQRIDGMRVGKFF